MNRLECRGLTKRFGPIPALDGVDLAIQPGRIVGLLGPNGSGKSTLIKLVTGLLTPTEGEIAIDGMAPGPATHGGVSYLPERPSLPQWMTVEGLQDFYEDFFPDFRREVSGEMLDRLEIDPRRRYKQLSKGTREKVQLILTMSRKAGLYLLDEPIGGVDPAARDYILDTIIRGYDPEASVILSTHLIADIERILDDVIFLRQGRVVLAGPADEVRAQKGMSIDGVFREVFRC